MERFAKVGRDKALKYQDFRSPPLGTIRFRVEICTLSGKRVVGDEPAPSACLLRGTKLLGYFQIFGKRHHRVGEESKAPRNLRPLDGNAPHHLRSVCVASPIPI
jgi:hypothetical protein